MFFDIVHTTRYTYDRPVSLEPHILRLRPRCDWNQRLVHFSCAIDPPPHGCARNLDLDGNAVERPWFSGSTDALHISVHSITETLCTNPFAYLIEPAAHQLPIAYTDALATALQPYSTPAVRDADVETFARDLAREAGGETLTFLAALNKRLNESWQTETRLEGTALPATETLKRGRGACRDLSLLFMESCRALGLATRFVSGYQQGSAHQRERYLHAWAEVYLPGAGWRGYDPSAGLVVADRHVVLAAGAVPSGAAPMTGSFRGVDATSHMEVEIEMRTSEAAPATTCF